MTTQAIPFTGGFLTRSNDPMGSKADTAFNADRSPIFDLRQDDALVARGSQDEFDIDDYIAGQDQQTRAEIGQAGKWVADTFYPGQLTLATLRLRKGLSQAALAAQCQLEQPHISRYEAGKVAPGLLSAEKLARALDVSLDVFTQAFKNSGR